MKKKAALLFCIPTGLAALYGLLACWPMLRPTAPYGLFRVYVPLLSAPLAALLLLLLLAWGIFLRRKGLGRSLLLLLLLPLASLATGVLRQADFVRPRTLEELAYRAYDDTVQLKYFGLSIQRGYHWEGYSGNGKRPTPAESAAWESIKSLQVTPSIPAALRKQIPLDSDDWTYVLSPSFRSQVDRSTTPSMKIYWYSEHLFLLKFDAFGGKTPPEPTYYYVPAGLPAEQVEALAKALLRTI